MTGATFIILPGRATLSTGSTIQLGVTAPAACLPASYTVGLPGSAVASVSPSGLVGALKLGETYISAVASDPIIRDSLHLTVVGSIQVNERVGATNAR